jgi:hypothetical protein
VVFCYTPNNSPSTKERKCAGRSCLPRKELLPI